MDSGAPLHLARMELELRAMAVMLDGLLLDRLAHPPQDHAVVLAAVRWLLSGPPTA